MSPAAGSRATTWSSVENPADESYVADITATPIDEVHRAIAEARRSFDGGVWSGVPARERAKVLQDFINHIESARDVLVPTLVAEAGQSALFAEKTQLVAGVAIGRQTIDLFLSMSHEQASPVPVDDLTRGRVALSIRRHEPVGVVARDHAVQRGADHGLSEAHSRINGRQLGDPAAQPANADLVADLRRRRRRGGAAAGCASAWSWSRAPPVRNC